MFQIAVSQLTLQAAAKSLEQNTEVTVSPAGLMNFWHPYLVRDAAAFDLGVCMHHCLIITDTTLCHCLHCAEQLRRYAGLESL